MGLYEGVRRWVEKDDSSVGDIQFLAVGISLLLTVVLVLQDHMPNDDGVVYLLSADLIAKGEWDGALGLINWPFFSFLIGLTHSVTGLDMETSAYVLNGLFQAILVYAFVAVVSEMGGGRKVALIAAVLILTYPEFNETRPEIVRDFGYWAFFVFALMAFLRFQKRPGFGALFAWTAALLVATLFRIEGIVLLGLMPLLFLAFGGVPRRQRLRQTLRIYGFYLLGLVILVFMLGAAGVDLLSVERWDKPLQLASLFYNMVSSGLAQKAQILREYYLVSYSADYAWMIVLATIMIVLVVEVASAVGIVYSLCAGVALFNRTTTLDRNAWLTLVYLIAANLLMLSLFVIMLGFLTNRYTLALTLLVLMLAAFGVSPVYRWLLGARPDSHRALWVNAFFALVAVYLLVDGVYSFSPGKVHVEKAAEWLGERLDPSESVFSLDAPFLYRVGRIDAERFNEMRAARRNADALRLKKSPAMVDMLQTIDWQQYDYVVAHVKRKKLAEQQQIDSLLGRSAIKVFENRKGDRAVIYATGSDN